MRSYVFVFCVASTDRAVPVGLEQVPVGLGQTPVGLGQVPFGPVVSCKARGVSGSHRNTEVTETRDGRRGTELTGTQGHGCSKDTSPPRDQEM